MRTKQEIKDLARSHFDGGFNCAESVLLTGTEIFDQQANNIPCIATPFGGGFSGNGYTCGAITGALMVIGLCYGRQEAAELEKKGKTYDLSDQLLKDFSNQFRSIYCKKLSGINFKTKEGVQKYKDHVHTETCLPIVEFAATWLGENL